MQLTSQVFGDLPRPDYLLSDKGGLCLITCLVMEGNLLILCLTIRGPLFPTTVIYYKSTVNENSVSVTFLRTFTKIKAHVHYFSPSEMYPLGLGLKSRQVPVKVRTRVG